MPRPPHDSRTFGTASGKAHFTVNPVTAVAVPPGHLLLQTIRSHDQFNTTVYGLNDRYRGVHGGRRVVFVAAKDLAELGLADGDVVDLVSVWSDGERRRPPSASSSTRRRPAAPPPTSPRPTSWSRSTRPPTRATPRRRSPSSSASSVTPPAKFKIFIPNGPGPPPQSGVARATRG